MYRSRNRSIVIYLKDILNAIDQIKNFIGSMDIREFSNDPKPYWPW